MACARLQRDGILSALSVWNAPVLKAKDFDEVVVKKKKSVDCRLKIRSIFSLMFLTSCKTLGITLD